MYKGTDSLILNTRRRIERNCLFLAGHNSSIMMFFRNLENHFLDQKSGIALPCRNGAGSEEQLPASEGFGIRMYCISGFWIFQKNNPWFSKGHDAISFQHCFLMQLVC